MAKEKNFLEMNLIHRFNSFLIKKSFFQKEK